LMLCASSPSTNSTRPLISTPLRFKPAREISIITEARGLARRFLYLCVCREVGIQILLPCRRNHIGTICIPPSSSSVAKLAIRVIESSFLISLELREGGPPEASLEELFVKLLLLAQLPIKEKHVPYKIINLIKSIFFVLVYPK
jgi:hypothetical protein